MYRNTIDGALFKDMLFMGAALLERNKQSIDAMNVFPVPDGDTGTNMSMTMQRSIQEIKLTNASTVEEVASALSMGALKGARGNSGVILSQIFRGFAKALKGAGDNIDSMLLASALQMGTEAAYKAVMKPKEGTMLTVSRLISEQVRASAAQNESVYKLVDIMLESGEAALRKTPEMLPVLKEADVLDSGGAGLLTIFRGFKMALDGEEIEDIDFSADSEQNAETQEATLEDVSEIKFGYCTELLIIHVPESVQPSDIEDFRNKLAKIGDSVVVVHDAEIIKVHVHSNAPGKAIQFALRLGEIDKIKIENMREQNRELAAQYKANEKEMGLIVVGVGEGINSVFKELGANYIIPGGQTMNPSIDVITQAIKRVNARNVFILPNNPNIIMAAQQAAEISDRNVIVIPTRTIVQGISSVMGFNPEVGIDENRVSMMQAFENVISGSVTFAVRDTSFDGNQICANDIIGLIDGKITAVSKTIDETTITLIRSMLAMKDNDAVVTIFFGEAVKESEAEGLVNAISADYPNVEFIVQNGGQPLYYYYISVE